MRPQVCAAVTAALADEATAQRASARPVCCGQPMRRHAARAVSWLPWVGGVRGSVERDRCRTCGQACRPLLDRLEVEPGRPSGWLARRVALLGSVVPFTLAAELAEPLLGGRANAMMVWRTVQRLGAAAVTYTDALSTSRPGAWPRRPRRRPRRWSWPWMVASWACSRGPRGAVGRARRPRCRPCRRWPTGRFAK